MAPAEADAIEPKTIEDGKVIDEKPVHIHESSQSSPELGELDYEKHGAGAESDAMPDLKRKLKDRHLQMIAIGWCSYIYILNSIFCLCSMLTMHASIFFKVVRLERVYSSVAALQSLTPVLLGP